MCIKCMGIIQDPHHLSIPAFGDLLELRQKACDRLYNARIKEAAAVAGDAEPGDKSAREEDMYVAGRVVHMQCPAIACNGESMEAREIATLWSVRDPVSLVLIGTMFQVYIWF